MKLFSITLFFFLISCVEKNNNNPSDADTLYTQTVKIYLNDDLATSRDMYDAGHYLMIPLHAAFFLNKEEWQNDFEKHFKNFIQTDKTNQLSNIYLISKLHYYYLLSEYCVLLKQYNRNQNLRNEILLFLNKEIEHIWKIEPAWQWERPDFNSMKERIDWKLSITNLSRSYFNVITDEELFLMAIACDLKFCSEDKNNYQDEIINYFYKVLNRITKTGDGGWLFQKGYWKDHPEYLYASYQNSSIQLEPVAVDGIAEDSSHSHRWPLWLLSLYRATNDVKIRDLMKGLAMQVVTSVLTKPSDEVPYYLFKNFMDGRNGLYRWNYFNYLQGEGNGPFELSGTYLLGWWSFLGDANINNAYQFMSNSFPIGEKSTHFFYDRSTREINPVLENAYYNGLNKFICLIASNNKHAINTEK